MSLTGIEMATQALVLNQRRFLETIREGDLQHPKEMLQKLEDHFGPRFIDAICSAISSTLRDSLTYELFSIQALNLPFGMIWKWQQSGMASLDVRIETRKLRSKIVFYENPVDQFVRGVYPGAPDPRLSDALSSAWEEVVVEGLAQLWYASTADSAPKRFELPSHRSVSHNIVTGPKCFEQIRRDAKDIEIIGRPAGRKVYKAGILDGLHHIYVDDVFPGQDVMSYRRPTSPFDGPMVWSPYLIAGDTAHSGGPVMLRIRHKFTLFERVNVGVLPVWA